MRGAHATTLHLSLLAFGCALAAGPLHARRPKEKARSSDSAPAAKKAPAPGARELMVKYLAALGGEAYRNVQTRLMLGSVEQLPAAPGSVSRTWKLELAWKDPAKAREVWLDEQGNKTRRSFDGTGDKGGWIVGPAIKRRRLRQLERVELVRLAALFQPAQMMPLDEAVIDRRDQVNGRDALVLRVKSGESIWLDAATALPLRLDLLADRPEPDRAGEFYYSQVYFEDWKFVGAAQLPHTIRRVLVDQTLTWRFTEVKQSIDLPDRLFKKPYFWRG